MDIGQIIEEMSKRYGRETTNFELAAFIARYPEVRSRLVERTSSAMHRVTSKYFGTGAGISDTEFADLRAHGFVRLGQRLTADQCQDVLDHFSDKQLYNGHTYANSDCILRNFEEVAGSVHAASYQDEDVITAPHLIELATDPEVIRTIQQYFGCLPTLGSVKCWWSFPRGSKGLTQAFHRDFSFQELTLFCYLVDVDETGGPHAYIKFTHSDAGTRHLENLHARALDGLLPGSSAGRPRASEISEFHRLSFIPGERELESKSASAGDVSEALWLQILKAQTETLTGPAGTTFLEDSYGLHRATMPTGSRRLILWIRYYPMILNDGYCGYDPEIILRRMKGSIDAGLLSADELLYITRLFYGIKRN